MSLLDETLVYGHPLPTNVAELFLNCLLYHQFQTLVSSMSPSIENGLDGVANTKLGDVSLHGILRRMREECAFPIAKKVVESGLLKTNNFPHVVPCLELIVSCANHYHPESHKI